MASVVIQDLTKIYQGARGENILAVDRASLEVKDGEFLVLVGPSGCGKSTILRMIAGLEDMSSGSISIDGQIVDKIPPKDRDVAMVFQNYALFPHMTAYENMAFGLKLRRYPKAEIEQRVREAAEMLGLADCLGRKPAAMSGGQRQRVAVGRAIVRKPKVFLFDEPLSNLDARMRAEMRREISRLHTRMAATMIYVTHDQVEAMTMGDRIAVMRGGVIQQVAPPLELYDHPANMFVAGFIGSPPMNFFRGSLARHDRGVVFRESLPADKGAPGFIVPLDVQRAAMLSNRVGGDIILGIRPEHILTGGNVEATVEGVEPTGAETYVYLNTGSHSFAARMGADGGATARQKLSLAFELRRASFFDPSTEERWG